MDAGSDLLEAEAFEDERMAAEVLVDGDLSCQAVLARLAALCSQHAFAPYLVPFEDGLVVNCGDKRRGAVANNSGDGLQGRRSSVGRRVPRQALVTAEVAIFKEVNFGAKDSENTLRGTAVLYFQHWAGLPHRAFRTSTNIRADILPASAHLLPPIAPISRLLVAPLQTTLSRKASPAPWRTWNLGVR